MISRGEAVLCSQNWPSLQAAQLGGPAPTPLMSQPYEIRLLLQYSTYIPVASTKQPRGPIKLRDSYEDLGALSNGRHLHQDEFNGRPLLEYFYCLPHPPQRPL